jgi:signal transduction histidine kinase
MKDLMQQQIIQAGIATLIITIISVLAVNLMPGLDRDILIRFVVAMGGNTSQISSQNNAIYWISVSGLINIIGFGVFAFASIWAALKLAVIGRSFVLVQLFVLSLITQWLVWQSFNIICHPIGCIAAVFLGSFFGYYLRSNEKLRLERQAQYYELMIRNKELQETRLSLVKQDEVERRILAADLHDQVLNDMKQLVHRFDNYVNSPSSEEADRIRKLTSQVMGEIREVMDSLCPSVLEHLGLPAAIEDCLRKGSERAGFKIRFKNNIDLSQLEKLSLVEQSLVYRLVQETITNICKHAEAKIVKAQLQNQNGSIVVSVIDDGKGIDKGKDISNSRGLRYMRLRADLIGARVNWREGENGKGTCVEIIINTASDNNGA